ncbi:hypothetical protein GUITHDRAFT_108920 [Guillardia theta CCMP2712]|uniref:Uncharacterized protein n=1 Tax=Guillardia theta (strain CCMP2712) TaxID=905079 RepID=L1J9S3_GUITC|nr:hypothetical protein GUITHDRAFT_108920 [Guillardia theta CCMP2712]EKX45278.1 hypothetical protein GUITHDRAFT_108920 [Guillardia theta CCMP2712]|eukprot:XP_005832258.1 hypothetical protein GUITHDRAFT_108920 [Guillardia theta CCMP2712]
MTEVWRSLRGAEQAGDAAARVFGPSGSSLVGKQGLSSWREMLEEADWLESECCRRTLLQTYREMERRGGGMTTLLVMLGGCVQGVQELLKGSRGRRELLQITRAVSEHGERFLEEVLIPRLGQSEVANEGWGWETLANALLQTSMSRLRCRSKCAEIICEWLQASLPSEEPTVKALPRSLPIITEAGAAIQESYIVHGFVMHGMIVHCEIPYLEDAKFVVLDCSLELQEMRDPVGCKQEIAREGREESLRMIELLVEDQIRSLARNGVQVGELVRSLLVRWNIQDAYQSIASVDRKQAMALCEACSISPIASPFPPDAPLERSIGLCEHCTLGYVGVSSMIHVDIDTVQDSFEAHTIVLREVVPEDSKLVIAGMQQAYSKLFRWFESLQPPAPGDSSSKTGLVPGAGAAELAIWGELEREQASDKVDVILSCIFRRATAAVPLALLNNAARSGSNGFRDLRLLPWVPSSPPNLPRGILVTGPSYVNLRPVSSSPLAKGSQACKGWTLADPVAVGIVEPLGIKESLLRMLLNVLVRLLRVEEVVHVQRPIQPRQSSSRAKAGDNTTSASDDDSEVDRE